MNADTKEKLVWSAVPTLFTEVPNPPKLLAPGRRPPKERASPMSRQQQEEICTGINFKI